MDIPHPLRERTRAQLARWAAAMAVFLGIAAALVAGGAHGPLASALASDHSRPAADSQGVQPEAVLGSEDVPPAGTTDPSGAPEPTAPEPTEPAPDPGPDPGMEPPVSGSPGDDGSTPAEQPNEPPVVDPEPGTGEPGPIEPSDPEQAEPTDPSGAPAERPAAEPGRGAAGAGRAAHRGRRLATAADRSWKRRGRPSDSGHRRSGPGG